MVETGTELVRQIVRRAPHEAAFRELVRRLDALPEDVARALIDGIEPRIANWPVETRQLRVGPRSALGAAARRLAAGVVLEWVSASSDRHIGEALGDVPSLVAVELMPLDDDAAGWIAMLPAGVRRVSVFSSPPRREAERFAARVADALSRLDALDGISLVVGHATAHLTPLVLERPLTAFSTRLAELADPGVLERLEPSTMSSLELHSIDGVPAAWTPAAVAGVVERLPGLVQLTCPWIEPIALGTLPSLERLRVTPVFGLESSSVDQLFASLPATLRSLAIPGLSGDATLAAFARCPLLEEMSWVGSKFSAEGIRSLLASGALDRLTSMELNGAIEPKEARMLFAGGAPQRLRHLDLFGLGLGDASIRSLARSTAWLERLVSLDVQSNDLSSKGLATLLDVLVDRADDLVSLAIDGNRLGPDCYERLTRLRDRGVAIDVELPETQRGAAPIAGPAVAPAIAVGAVWGRLDAWLETNGIRAPGLGAPATKAALEEAARLPPSLRASYAAHDGADETELLGLGRVVWWRLADVLSAEPEERSERKFVVFAAPLDASVDGPYEPEELPALDDDLDMVFAVAIDTEEVVALGRRGSVDVVAQDLGTALDAVVTALETGRRTLDENGRLQDGANDRAGRSAAAAAPTSPVEELAAAIVERHVVELRAGASAKELAAALAEAVSISNPKARMRAVLAVFESTLVDEIFVDDDELAEIAGQVARHFA